LLNSAEITGLQYKRQNQEKAWNLRESDGGADGDRTHDLLTASQSHYTKRIQAKHQETGAERRIS